MTNRGVSFLISLIITECFNIDTIAARFISIVCVVLSHALGRQPLAVCADFRWRELCERLLVSR